MPMTDAERQRRRREKLKNLEPEKFEQKKRKHAEYMRNKRKPIGQLTETEQNRRRRQWREANEKRKIKKYEDKNQNKEKANKTEEEIQLVRTKKDPSISLKVSKNFTMPKRKRSVKPTKRSEQITDSRPSQGVTSSEPMAAAAFDQRQKDECENTSCVNLHERNKQALSDMTVRWQNEMKLRKKIVKENVTLKKHVEKLKNELVESNKKNREVNVLIQNLKIKTETSTNILMNSLRQQVSEIDSTAKLVQQINQNKQSESDNCKRKRNETRKPKNKRRKRSYSSDDDDDEIIEEVIEDFSEEVDEEDVDNDDDETQSYNSDSTQVDDVPENYRSGNFLLRKSDVKWDGDKIISKLDDLILMKIEGKALLQKYVPAVFEGRILYKVTCMYTGWNPALRNDFYSVTEILDQSPTTECKDACVALNIDDLVILRNKCDSVT